MGLSPLAYTLGLNKFVPTFRITLHSFPPPFLSRKSHLPRHVSRLFVRCWGFQTNSALKYCASVFFHTLHECVFSVQGATWLGGRVGHRQPEKGKRGGGRRLSPVILLLANAANNDEDSSSSSNNNNNNNNNRD